jgi:hypothetical protein
MPRTKAGEQITWKEFGKRWKVGMQNLTPTQRTFNDIVSSFVILIGFIASLLAIIFFGKQMGWIAYGLSLIFIGNIYSIIIKIFSLFGQYKTFKGIETNINSQDLPEDPEALESMTSEEMFDDIVKEEISKLEKKR